MFVAMHWFGRGCGGGHSQHHEEGPGERREAPKEPDPGCKTAFLRAPEKYVAKPGATAR